MLYILPPPRSPDPPSPWSSILYNNSPNGSSTSWKRSRVRLKNLSQNDTDDLSEFQNDNMDTNRNHRSLSECYFAGKSAALALPAVEVQIKSNIRSEAAGSNIRNHLQFIVDLLMPEETLKMAVKLESAHSSRIRYLVIVSRMGKKAEESCLLGIDCNEKTTIGLVLKVLADTKIRLDGDGGFSVSVCHRHHIFKPVSVQAMWSALQTLHKVSSKAREQNFFQGGFSHEWVHYYEEKIESDRSCLNEWHAMDNLESRRPPSPDSIRTKPTETKETEKVIRTTLKEIMMLVDLDEVTSKYIRNRLEEHLDMDLGEYKSFIDQEMLTILGQMDAPTEIFEHVYLGSEWNASNYEELQRNGVGHILNVTQEIDNFFPGTFIYYNIRVCDDEKTDLLKYWDDTFKYISKVKRNGSKVLVHCKMGISRSASVVIAYAMKEYNWDFKTAFHHVKEKRNCIKPNTSFISQLETYQGILDAMKNKEKLQRSKSENNLKSSDLGKPDKILVGGAPTPIVYAFPEACVFSGQDLRNFATRPKSWSPENDAETESELEKSPMSVSLEDLSQKSQEHRHILMPCDNGESYSVSPNQIFHLPGQSVKDRVSEFELKEDGYTFDKFPSVYRTIAMRKDTWDPGDMCSIPSSCNSTSDSCDSQIGASVIVENRTVWTSSTIVKNVSDSDSNSVPQTKERQEKSDPFSNQLDKVFDREEKRQIPEIRECPSRQSSWSSYDSAVVLGSQTEVGVSRHSSWGSGDTKILPSRNSSWGSYDMRPRGPVVYKNEKGEKILHNDLSGVLAYDKEEILGHPGTVKKTAEKIEEKNKVNDQMTKSSSSETLSNFCDDDEKPPVEAINRKLIKNLIEGQLPASAISPVITIPFNANTTLISRLSMSAPETSSLDLLPSNCSLFRSTSNVSSQPRGSIGSSVRQQRFNLENLQKEHNVPIKTVETDPGIVRRVKKEFEAKTGTNTEFFNSSFVETKKNKINSLPCSPVSVHQDKEKIEEINFKNLLGLFENNQQETQVVRRPKSSDKLPRDSRYSCLEVSNNRWKNGDKCVDRPQITPVVRNTAPCLVASVIASATKKQQQYGKSHPLAKLTIKPRHNNPLYNTM